jgi:bacterioferritin-associated ferredoxin
VTRRRRVLCPCEDVLVEDVEEAVELGYEGLEEIKRLTAVATGPCQGRWCLRATIELLADLTDASCEELGSITHRQPVKPVPLDALAKRADPEDEDDEP